MAATTTNGKPFLGYARISRLGKREKGNNVSIREQRRQVRQIAQLHGLELLPELIEDEDVSGATFERPGWRQAVERIEAGEVAGLVAYDMERISRGKTALTLLAIEEIEAVGGQVYDHSGRVSVADPNDEVTATVRAMIARQDHRKRAAYLDNSVRQAIERGVHLSAPFGYRKSGGKGSPLAVDAREAPVVRRMFELRAAGWSWGAIASELNKGEVMPRPYKRHGLVKQGVWMHKTVRQMVMSPVYTGMAYNGSRKLVGAHPMIVEPELYRQASQVKGTKWDRPAEGYLLSGLVRCASCGYAMTHQNTPGSAGYRYYRCRDRQHGAGRCAAPTTVPAAQLEAFVATEFKKHFLDVRFVPVEADETSEELRAELGGAKARLGGLLALAGDLETMSAGEREVFEEQITASRTRIRELESGLAEALMRARGLDLPADLTETGFDDAPLSKQRHWLSLVFGAVIVRPAALWREPVAQRARFLSRHETPGDSLRLIAKIVDG